MVHRKCKNNRAQLLCSFKLTNGFFFLFSLSPLKWPSSSKFYVYDNEMRIITKFNPFDIWCRLLQYIQYTIIKRGYIKLPYCSMLWFLLLLLSMILFGWLLCRFFCIFCIFYSCCARQSSTKPCGSCTLILCRPFALSFSSFTNWFLLFSFLFFSFFHFVL